MECKKCQSKNIEEDEARAEMICQGCGEVCEINDIQGVTEFHEMDNGKVVALGKTIYTHESRQNTINKAQEKIDSLCAKLFLKKSLAAYAMRIFKSVLGRGLTRGKKSSIMIGACIYLAARINQQSLMLLDVSDKINENVYAVGKVYNQIKQIFGQKVSDIDPCLFIDRFAAELELGDMRETVSITALKLLQRMKKDWISTGRRPSGMTAAALLIAARIHHFDRHYEDVARIAGISQQTAKKRLQEWSETATANLTLSEFRTIDYEEEFDPPSFYDQKYKKDLSETVITEEEFEKIKENIKQMHQQLEEAEQKQQSEDSCFSQLVSSVEEGIIDISQLMGEMDDNTSDIEDELNGRRDLFKACFKIGKLEEEFQTPSSKLENEVENDQLNIPSELPLIISIPNSNPQWAIDNDAELDLDGIDDEELTTLYISSKKESLKKLKWWYKENKEFYRNKKQAQARKNEKKQRDDMSGKKPRTKRSKREFSMLADAVQLLREIKPGTLDDSDNYETPMKTPKLSPESTKSKHGELSEHDNEAMKDEMKDSPASDHGDDSDENKSDQSSLLFEEPNFDYEECS